MMIKSCSVHQRCTQKKLIAIKMYVPNKNGQKSSCSFGHN